MTDFGHAQDRRQNRLGAAHHSAPPIFGTAPEVHLSRFACGARSDAYSLAALAFQLFSGGEEPVFRRAFGGLQRTNARAAGQSFADYAADRARNGLAVLAQPGEAGGLELVWPAGTPPALEALVRRGLSRAPLRPSIQELYGGAAHILADLEKDFGK